MSEVRYHKDVLLFLDELFDVLIEKEYFCFYETSARYIEDLVAFIDQNINTLPHKVAPPHFSRYGSNLLYITYLMLCRRDCRANLYIPQAENASYKNKTLSHVSANHI